MTGPLRMRRPGTPFAFPPMKGYYKSYIWRILLLPVLGGISKKTTFPNTGYHVVWVVLVFWRLPYFALSFAVDLILLSETEKVDLFSSLGACQHRSILIFVSSRYFVFRPSYLLPLPHLSGLPTSLASAGLSVHQTLVVPVSPVFLLACLFAFLLNWA